MTFFNIIKKNFVYNFNKYISFYFVNSLITAMLFMYGSLMFNKSIEEGMKGTSIIQTVQMSFLGLVIFSIVFITYTNVAFLKNRGKEFGMYLTLGMTRKELVKLVLFENLAVMFAALITGIITGAIFGKLFYMGLSKILGVTILKFSFELKSVVLSVLIFGLIFLGNIIFNIFYVRKVKIIEAIKAKNKKGIGKSSIILGLVSLILLVISMILLPKVLLGTVFKEQSFMSGIFIVITFVAPYAIIGSILSIIKYVLKKFPRLYNNNLMVLSSLSHKFVAYKNMIFMLSLLIIGVIFFCGYSYSMYATSEDYVREEKPFDIIFIENEKYNDVDEKNLKNKLDSVGVEDYKELEYIEATSFIEEDGAISLWSDLEEIVSESNYNKHMGSNVDVKKGDMLDVSVYEEKMDHTRDSKIIAALDDAKIEEIGFEDVSFTQEEIDKFLAGEVYVKANKVKQMKGEKYTNIVSNTQYYENTDTYNTQYYTGDGVIVDDSDYELLKAKVTSDKIKSMHVLNVKNEEKAKEILNPYLLTVNNLDNTYWKDTLFNDQSYKEESDSIMAEGYKPTYTFEVVKKQITDSGMMFFIMMFMGLLFVIANGIVLYYKVLSDIGDEKERVVALKRIGSSKGEIKRILSMEMAITFFAPIIIGSSMGIYYLYVMLSNAMLMSSILSKAFIVVFVTIVIQVIFYLISRRKYLSEIL